MPLQAIACAIVVLAALPATAESAPRPKPAVDRRPVPILMYHVIDVAPADAPYPDLYVPRAEFAAQVRWLERAGFEAVTLARVFDAWHGRATLPRRPVVLSFDDGYRSHVTAALPPHGAAGLAGCAEPRPVEPRPVVGSPARGVRRLIAAGWEVDAHSLTHADVSALGGAALEREVRGSRQMIKRLFGIVPRFFCYPAGRYDAEAVAAVRAAGFEGATTTEYGLADVGQPYTLARVRVSRGDGAAGLSRKLASLGA